MRKIYSLLLLGGLLLFGVGNLWGTERTFAGTEKFYFNADIKYSDDNSHWWPSDGKVFAYFYRSVEGDDPFSWSDEAVQLKTSAGNTYNGICSVTVPAGTWSHVIIVSQNSNEADLPKWDAKIKQTGDIVLDATRNYIYGLKENDNSASWSSVSSYTVSFVCPADWSKISLYTVNANEDYKQLGNWPGTVVANTSTPGTIYSLTFETDVIPAKIIFNNDNNGKQSIDFPFTNGAQYANSYSITPTPDGYATFYAPCNVEIPAKATDNSDITVTAYTGTYSSGYLTLAALTGNTTIIPAGEAVVLKSTGGNKAFVLTPTTSSEGTAGTNTLVGTSKLISTPANSYVLGRQGEPAVTAFYKFTGDNIPANKAYLVIGSYPAPSIRFEEENATDIHNVEANEKAVKFFENGQLLIMREGVVYDAIGRIVR